MKYFKDMMSSGSEASSKRFIGVMGSMVAISLIVAINIIYSLKSNKGVDIDPVIVEHQLNNSYRMLAACLALLGVSGFVDGARKWMEKKNEKTS